MVRAAADVIMSCEQRSGEAEGPRDHEREPETAGAGLQDALQGERALSHTHTHTHWATVLAACSPAALLVQEEMVRLQQNIEELKAASGQDNEEEKVASVRVCLWR